MSVSFDQRDGYIWYNGDMVAWADAQVHVLTHGLHYGSCVFEGERAYGGSIFKLTEHTERLVFSARELGFELPYSVEEIDRACEETLKANNLVDGYLRPVAWRGSEMMGVSAQNNRINVAIAAWEWPSYMDPNAKRNGISVVKSPFQQYDNPLYSNNKIIGTYVNSIMAVNDAISKGAEEAILLDKNGFISEGSG